MVRKRGRARFSSALRRIRRFDAKYVVDALTKRPKKLLPYMHPSMRQALINWDYLETLLFPKFEELGIPSDQYEYYLAWAKRKASMGLHFYVTTQVVEFDILTGEFVERGLEKDLLNQLEPIVDYWLDLMQGKIETLACSSYTAEFNQWEKQGASPYLNLNDGDTNSIHDEPPYGDYDGDYHFENGSGKGEIEEVKLHVIGEIKYGAPDGYGIVAFRGYIFGGDPIFRDVNATWFKASDVGYVEKVIDFSTWVDTWERVNLFNIKVKMAGWYGSPIPTIYLTQAYLVVKHT